MERGGAYALAPVTPYANLGAPDWAGCGAGAPEIPLLQQAPLEIALTDEARNCGRIRQLGVAELLAETIRRIAYGESVSSLYVD